LDQLSRAEWDCRVAEVTGAAARGAGGAQGCPALVYQIADRPKSDLNEAFEPMVNASEIELLDLAKLQEQLLTLVWLPGGRRRGGFVTPLVVGGGAWH
jgi:hypothetical protein